MLRYKLIRQFKVDLTLEWFGYLASVVVAVSLLMNSLLRLRWINLVGAAMFSTYGFLIGAMPVFALNGFIVLINIYYLRKAYNQKEYFQIQEISQDSLYLKDFLKFYHNEIQIFFPNFQFKEKTTDEHFFVLRNMQVARIFLAHLYDNETLVINLDFAIPEYRDFKLAKYVFSHQEGYFQKKGYTKLYTPAQSPKHNTYLRKIGFQEVELDNIPFYIKRLSKM